MEFRTLGVFEVRGQEGAPLALSGRLQPLLLVALLLHANRPVPVERLIDALWEGQPPESARHRVHLLVHRLRRALAAHGATDRIRTRGTAYTLTVEPGELDTDRFQQALAQARADAAAGRLADAFRGYDAALALWTGSPLAEFATTRLVRPVIERLEELRVAALTERAEVLLGLGRHAELIPTLEELTRQYPMQERLYRLLMLALYRSGRQADALTSYQTARAALVDQLGIEPGADLKRLQRAILIQDPTLAAPPGAAAAAAPDASPPPAAESPVAEPPASSPAPPARTADPHQAAGTPGQPEGADADSPDRVERRSVTVLAATVRARAPRRGAGPTAPRGGDPEEFWEPHRRVVERLRRTVKRLGGVVYGDVGGTAVAAFGVPRGHADDPERAVRAALDVLDALPGPERATVHVGIDSGEAVVTIPSAQGDPPYVSGAVVYDAVAVAARAPAGEVLVGPRTHALTARSFEYQEIELTGAEPHGSRTVWRVAGTGAATGTTGPPTPTIGRERELTILHELLDRATEHLEPQLVTIFGAPGTGKSRLARELRARSDHGDLPAPTAGDDRSAVPAATGHARERIVWREGRSLPYGEGVTFWALAEIVKDSAGVQATDRVEDAEARLRRLATAVLADLPDPARVIAYLQRLVHPEGAADDDAGWRQEAFVAWRTFLEASAGDLPTVLVFEDMHWADDALLDFVEYLADRAHDVPLLIVCLAWPDLLDRRPRWGGGTRNATTISLQPLSEAHTEELLGSLLAQHASGDGERDLPGALDDLDAASRAKLLAASGGNPLFVEEYVRRLRGRAADQHAAVGEEALLVPETVQLLINARIDDLLPRERALLADAAVLGERFWTGALVAVSDLEPDEVDAALRRLTRREFLRRVPRSTIPDQVEHTFRHILIRDVAYGRLLRGDRAERHRRVTTWLEDLGADRAADHAELIAHHYLQAVVSMQAAGGRTTDDVQRLRDRAAPALRRAGDRAAALGGYQAAVRYYSQALELWPDTLPGRLEVLLAREELLVDLHLVPNTDLHAELRDGLLAAGDRVGAATVEAMISSHAWRLGQFAAAVEHDASARELLRDAPPSAAKARALAELTVGQSHLNRHAVALEVGEEALALARSLGLRKLEAKTLYPVGLARTVLGDPDQGLAELRRSMTLLEQQQSVTLPRALIGYIAALAHVGDLPALQETAAALLRTAEQLDSREMRVWAQGVRLAVHYLLGEWDHAVALADPLISQIQAAGGHYFEGWCRCVRAKIRFGRGDTDGALEDTAAALRRTDNADDHIQLPVLALHGFLLTAGFTPAGGGDGDVPEVDPVAEGERVAASLRDRIPGRVITPFAGAELADLMARWDQVPDLDPRHVRASPWLRALVAFRDGRPDQAAAIYAGVGDRAAEAFARLRAGQRWAAADRTADAVTQLTQARAFYAGVRAVRYLDEIDALLAELRTS